MTPRTFGRARAGRSGHSLSRLPAMAQHYERIVDDRPGARRIETLTFLPSRHRRVRSSVGDAAPGHRVHQAGELLGVQHVAGLIPERPGDPRKVDLAR